MKNNRFLVTGVILVIAIGGFFLFRKTLRPTHNPPPKPIEHTINPTVPPSTFNLPIHIKTSTLADYLNDKFRGSFLKKNIPLEKDGKEEIALTMTKRDDIRINSTGHELVCTFPLESEVKLIDSRFGKLLAGQVAPMRTSLTLTLSTPIRIDRNWHIVTRFRIKNIRWLNEPVARLGPFKKNIRPEITKLLHDEGDKLTAMLDREIHKMANLRPTIADIWLDLQQPILVSRKPTPLWLRFLCNNIEACTLLGHNEIVCHTHIEANMLIMTDTTSQNKPNPLPELRYLNPEKKRKESDINLYANTSFQEINEQLNTHLRGTTISKRGYRVKIGDISAYASEKGLSVGVSMEKDLKAYVVTSGKVVFNPHQQTLKVQEFDYFLNTKDFFINTGNELLHEFVRDSVAARLNLNLDTLIDKVPATITRAIAKEKAGEVIDLGLDTLRITRCNIMLDREKIHLLLNIRTNARLRLKKIKPGKTIRIRQTTSVLSAPENGNLPGDSTRKPSMPQSSFCLQPPDASSRERIFFSRFLRTSS